MELELVALVDKLVQQLGDLGATNRPVDVGRIISNWYWQVTLLLVLGKYLKSPLCSEVCEVNVLGH